MKTRYAIVCGSRSGSTYLCELLRSTNRCGNPQEFFNPALVSDYKRQLKLSQSADLMTYKHKVMNQFATANSVFGVKIVGCSEQLELFTASGLQPTHWIWLEREDKILQAISRYKAWKTNRWHKRIGDSYPAVEYSQKDIQWCLDEIYKEEEFFADFFSDKDHIKISYELDLCAEPDQTILACLAHMDINIDEIPELKSESVIVRNDEAETWKEWFIRDTHFENY